MSWQGSLMDNAFLGFTDDSFGFFRELALNNHKAWFDRNRTRYEQHITGTFRGLLGALEPFLLKLNPQFETSGKTNGNFSRINRDIRFSKDKSPYKSNYYLYVFDRRRDRGEAGRLYVGLSAECVTVGFSIYAMGIRDRSGALESIFRKRLLAHREVFNRLLAKSVRAGRYETYWHRQEKGEWVLHPGLPRRDEDWLTLHAWIVRKVFPAENKSISSPNFAERVKRVFTELYPLYVFTSSESPRWRMVEKMH
jgi:uncharacterized protein (TIGR02453 family)